MLGARRGPAQGRLPGSQPNSGHATKAKMMKDLAR
jgi:hypothetical protein